MSQASQLSYNAPQEFAQSQNMFSSAPQNTTPRSKSPLAPDYGGQSSLGSTGNAFGHVSPPQAQSTKISAFQRTLLIRWINTLRLSRELITIQSIYDEVRTGVLLCEILHFQQPKLDLQAGLNYKAVSKRACINNIEKALQVLYQKSAPIRFIPTAEEIFEGEKH